MGIFTFLYLTDCPVAYDYPCPSRFITNNTNLRLSFSRLVRQLQVSLVICGLYVPSFWTANLEFADKKYIFD